MAVKPVTFGSKWRKTLSNPGSPVKTGHVASLANRSSTRFDGRSSCRRFCGATFVVVVILVVSVVFR